MKKFTSLMVLFCMFVSTAWADIAVGQMYRLKSVAQNLYLTVESYNQSSGGAYGTVPFLAKSEGDEDQVFTFENANEGTYYLKSKSGYYITLRAWNVDATDSKSELAIEPVEGDSENFYLKNVSANKFFKEQNVGGVWHPFCDASREDANKWTLETVDESEFAGKISVTYVYKIGDKVLTTSDPVVQEKNSAASAPSVKFVNIDGYTGTIGEEDCEIIVNCSENLPFEVTTDLSHPVWQLVEMHRYGTFRVWEYSANDAAVKVVNYATNKSAVIEDNKFWCFTGNLVDGFKIYNKAATTAYTLNATDGYVSVGTATDGNDLWKLVASTATSDPAACFTNNGTSFMNQNNAEIKYHNEADNGSTCYFYDYEDLADFVLTEADEIKNVPTGVVGAYIISEETQTEFDNAYSALVADKANIEASKNLVSIINSINEGDKIELTAGYYFIKATGNGGNAKWYLTHKLNNDNGKECVWAQEPSTSLNADYVWKFETFEDGFKIQSANVGKYFQMKTATNGGDNNTYIENDYNAGNKFLLTNNGAGKFIIKNANNQNIRTENGGQVNYWDGEASETWYLIPVYEIDIDITNAGWATMHLPFAVEVPESLNAYAVSAVDAEGASLTQKDVIPANEGVLLEGEEGSYTLTITSADPWDDNANLLEGTNVTTEFEGSAYILSAPEGEVGLYLTALKDGVAKFQNKANKAYLPADLVPAGVRSLVFNFGGETAIESVEGVEDAKNAVIFDLAGRRVQKAQKGLYIVNGKKVVR